HDRRLPAGAARPRQAERLPDPRQPPADGARLHPAGRRPRLLHSDQDRRSHGPCTAAPSAAAPSAVAPSAVAPVTPPVPDARRRSRMGARQRLNSLHLNTALVVAAVTGLLLESWFVFLLVAVLLIGGMLAGGDIRLEPDRPRRRTG